MTVLSSVGGPPVRQQATRQQSRRRFAFHEHAAISAAGPGLVVPLRGCGRPERQRRPGGRVGDKGAVRSAPPRLVRRAREVVCPRIPRVRSSRAAVTPPWPTRPASGPGRGVFKDAFERRAETLEVPLEDESEERLGQAARSGRRPVHPEPKAGALLGRLDRNATTDRRSLDIAQSQYAIGSYSATSTSSSNFFPPGARWTSRIRDPTRSGPSVSGTAETVFVCQVASLVASVTTRTPRPECVRSRSQW